jgi:hypothetical protein
MYLDASDGQSHQPGICKKGVSATVVNGGGYSLVRGPAVNSWLDPTVQVAKVSDLTLEQWLEGFKDLKRKNEQITRTGTAKPKQRSGSGKRSAAENTRGG